MNERMAHRAVTWTAAQFRWAKHGPITSDAFRAHCTMGIGAVERRVSVGQVWRPDEHYVTAMYECETGCDHDHEFNHWYSGECDHQHVIVHLALTKDDAPRVVWAVAFDVDTVVRSVPRTMWERQVARKSQNGSSFRGQSFMRLPLDILYDLRGPGGAIMGDVRINVEEPA